MKLDLRRPLNGLAAFDFTSSRFFKVRWLIFLIAAIFYAPMMPGCVMAHSPKFGRVVDITTGKGIADAYVIAAAYMVDRGDGLVEAHTSTTTEYRVVARTDSDGRYWIPNRWLHLEVDHFFPFLLLFGTHEESWALTAVKLGYVLEDDWREREDAISSGRKNAATIYWYERKPTAIWLGPVVKVAPILLRPTHLDVGAAAQYYGNAVSLGTELLRRELTPKEIALRQTTYEYFLPKACALDPETDIDWGSNMGAFVLDPHMFVSRLNALESPGFEYNTKTGNSDKVKDICEAMKDEIVPR